MDPKTPSSIQDSSKKQGESVKSQKEIIWKQKIAEINEITDRLGKKIDEKIKKTVVAFLAYKFDTIGSCEGHIAENEEEEHGLPYPWVEIYAPVPEEWQESEGEKKKQLEKILSMNNFRQQRKMMLLLEKFYQKRETPFDARLIFEKIGIFGGFRIQSFGARIMTILNPEEKKQRLEIYRKEMEDFTDFLKSEYFSEK